MAATATPESAALQGETFIELFPGLKPWAEVYSPFGAGPFGPQTSRNTYCDRTEPPPSENSP
jgi:hypothetical protein